MGFENGRLARCVFEAQQGAQQEVLVLHYDMIGSNVPGQGDGSLQSLANRLADDVLPHWKARFTPAWNILPVVVTDEKDPQNPLAARDQVTAGTSGAGTSTNSGDFMPSACCIVVTVKTAKIGRRFTGRMFLGGDNTEGEAQNSLWTAAKVADTVSWLSNVPLQPDIVEGQSDATANLCVYSRTQRAANEDPYAEHVTGFVVRNVVHWLRRREPGR